MIHKFKHKVYRRIREYGGLSRQDVAKAIGKNRQVVWRWEQEGQMPSPEDEAILVAEAKLTPLAFVQIIAEVLSELVEEARVVVEPGAGLMARAPLLRAAKNYRANFGELDEEQRAAIEAGLNQGRLLDSVVEQVCEMLEKQIAEQIERALKALPTHHRPLPP